MPRLYSGIVVKKMRKMWYDNRNKIGDKARWYGMNHTLEKMAEHRIMSRKFLRNMKMEKKDMIKLLSTTGWRKRLTELARQKNFTAAGLEQALEPVLCRIAQTPEGGWLKFLCDAIKASL